MASLLTLASGVWMLGRVAKQVVQSGGSFETPLAWTIMSVLGVVMVAIFMHIRFVLYKRLGRAVAASEQKLSLRASIVDSMRAGSR